MRSEVVAAPKAGPFLALLRLAERALHNVVGAHAGSVVVRVLLKNGSHSI